MQDRFRKGRPPRFRFRTAAGAEPLTESLAFQPRPVRFIRKGKKSVIRGGAFFGPQVILVEQLPHPASYGRRRIDHGNPAFTDHLRKTGSRNG